jgi:gas vesicle protein
MAKGTAKKLAIGAAVAAAAGYVAGVLTAPKAGRETRKQLRGSASDTLNGAENQFHTAQEEVKHLIDEAGSKRAQLTDKAKQELDEAKTLAVDARDKAQQVLAAVRRGQADDVQLQRAINDVKAAGKHLKEFVTKTPGKVTKAKAARQSSGSSTSKAKSTKRNTKS